MLQEKKSQSNNMITQIFLLIASLFGYFVLKNRGFGYFNYIFENILSSYIKILENILIVLIVIILTNLFIKITRRIIKRYLERKQGSKKDIKLFLTVYKYFVWVLAVFITFSLLFKQIGSLITSLGLIGFGITFALQKPILNFVGWITIVFSKSYKIGDIISINNMNGRVYDIRVMYTNLSELTAEGDSTGRSISMPNEFVLTTPIINYTKGTSYVWDTVYIYLTYQSNWKKALKIIEKESQEFYDKNIKNDMRKAFPQTYRHYEKVVVRLNIYEKGIYIKARYIVNFDVANQLKTEIYKNLLEKLRIKGIVLGKIENIDPKFRSY